MSVSRCTKWSHRMTPRKRPNALLSGEQDRGIRERLELVKLVLEIVSLIVGLFAAFHTLGVF